MHHFYTLLAMDLANERALEAQRSTPPASSSPRPAARTGSDAG